MRDCVHSYYKAVFTVILFIYQVLCLISLVFINFASTARSIVVACPLVLTGLDIPLILYPFSIVPSTAYCLSSYLALSKKSLDIVFL